jgi:hypothetical protein
LYAFGPGLCHLDRWQRQTLASPRTSRLEDALRLVHPYGEKESPKYERAAMRWLERYLAESSPGLPDFAKVVASFAGRVED